MLCPSFFVFFFSHLKFFRGCRKHMGVESLILRALYFPGVHVPVDGLCCQLRPDLHHLPDHLPLVLPQARHDSQSAKPHSHFLSPRLHHLLWFHLLCEFGVLRSASRPVCPSPVHQGWLLSPFFLFELQRRIKGTSTLLCCSCCPTSKLGSPTASLGFWKG